MGDSKRKRVRFGVGLVVVALASATLGALTVGSAAAGSALAKNDPGVGSAAALANPKCDPATKRVKYQTYAAPLCVKPWKDGADNGGATAQGVTAKTIKVAVLYGDLDATQIGTKGLYTNQATGQNSPTAPVDSTKDNNEVYKSVYETWGRTVEFTFVKTSGGDEAAQRADAVQVGAMKPFAVLDEASQLGTPPAGGGAVFQQALKNAGVPFVFPDATAGAGPASRQYSLPAAEFIGKQLKGGKAEYADESMKNQPRKFGVLYPSNFDIDYFKAQLKKYGVTIASEASYTVPAGSVNLQASGPDIDEQIPTLITKLKSAGVNNLIMMATHAVAGTASKTMKTQEWLPEITLTSYPYTDLDVLARGNDPDVWSHAFGLIWFLPGVTQPAPNANPFQWFWGTDKGTMWAGSQSDLAALYTVVQFAGPTLNKKTIATVADTLRKGSAGIGGAYSHSAFTFEAPPPAPDGGVTTRGAALGWWNPNEEGPGNFNLGIPGKGEYMYLDQAQRYIPGTYPKAKKKFFAPENSTSVFPALPASEPKWPTYPCENCPSTGNTSITPGAASQ
jgi:hypothetical protein